MKKLELNLQEVSATAGKGAKVILEPIHAGKKCPKAAPNSVYIPTFCTSTTFVSKCLDFEVKFTL